MSTLQEMLDAEVRQHFRNRRDRFALAAITGMLNNAESWSTYPPEMARIAVKIADALIAELDKET